MNRKRLLSKLLSNGFAPLGANFFVKIIRKGSWYFGTGVLVTPNGAMQFKAAEHIPDHAAKALAVHLPEAQKAAIVAGFPDDLDEMSVAGFGDWLKRKSRGFRKAVKGVGKGFRRKVNKTAKALARMKIVKTLQRAKMKILQSPIADVGMGAASAALSAFGIPPNVSRAAMQHARDVQVDRLKHGGWLGLTARATGKGGLRGAMREGMQRHKRAGMAAARSLIPGLKSQAGRRVRGHANKALKRAWQGGW